MGTHVQELSAGLTAGGDIITVLSGTVEQQKHFVDGMRTVHLVPPDQDQRPGRSMVQGILDYNHTLASYAEKMILGHESIPDIIHCHNWITYPAAVKIASVIHSPVITTIHYLHPVEEWWGQAPDAEILKQEENLFRNGQTFIAVSQSIRLLMREFYSVPEQRVRVIYNAVDPELFRPSSVSNEYLDRLKFAISPGNEKVVLFTGRFHRMKGIPALLKSAELVLQKEPNVRYLMAGNADSKAFALEVRELLDRNPILKQKVTVLGKLNRQQIALLYSLANVAILPSVYDPCPYAAIEAMAVGVPLLASNGGGLAELVDDGVTGLTVPVRMIQETGLRSVAPEELAEATLLLLRDENLARKMGKAARRKASEAYSPHVMVRATREVYQSALDDARRACNDPFALTVAGHEGPSRNHLT